MNKLICLSTITSFFLGGYLFGEPVKYPEARIEKSYETKFGQVIYTPFRWMDNLDDPELGTWVPIQNKLTDIVLSDKLKKELNTEFEDILNPKNALAKYSSFDHGNQFFQRQIEKSPINDHTNFAEQRSLLSPNEKYQIQQVSDSGSDFKTIRVLDIESNTYLPDVLQVKFASFLWAEDSQSFIYSSDQDGRVGNHIPVIRKHVIKTAQNKDKIIFLSPTADTWISLYKTDNGYFLTQSRKNHFKINNFSLTEGIGSLIFEEQKDPVNLSKFSDGLFYLISYKNAPMGKIITLDSNSGAQNELVPESKNSLASFILSGKNIYLTYIKDTSSLLVKFDTEKKDFVNIPLPIEGTVSLRSGKEPTSIEIGIRNYTTPGSIWKLDKSKNSLTLVDKGPDSAIPLESKKIFYKAHNGKNIPIWLVMKKGLELSKDTPTYLYGYGGFKINILPGYRSTYTPFLKRGGVVAVVTLPGGLEYGEEWHKAGNLLNKRNVFDDFASAAKRLISLGYTSSGHLAIGGGSNGGLLVGATMNLYPELFNAAVPEVGVMDLLKYQFHTGGKWWVSEYGDQKEKDHFLNLQKLSPYHNLKENITYPNTLVMTANLDDRVVASHSYKYAALLQMYQSKNRLALLYSAKGSSHSARNYGLLKDRVNYVANKWSFIINFTK